MRSLIETIKNKVRRRRMAILKPFGEVPSNTVARYNSGTNQPIRTLAIPGLGTGVGGLTPDDAAEQMRVAYDNVAGGQWRQVRHPAMAPYALGKSRLVMKSKENL